jgi:hypothetical protein
VSPDVHVEVVLSLLERLHGTPERIKAGHAAHLDAGANHVSVQVLVAPGDDPMPGYRTLARVLNEPVARVANVQ